MSNYNPYSPPVGGFGSLPQKQRPLADLGKPFLGALIDGISGMVFVGPGYLMAVFSGLSVSNGGGQQNPPGPLLFVGVGLALLGFVALLGLNIYLLVTRSQSLGKYVVKTQIVNVETGERADFVSSFLMRAVVNGIISSIPCIGAIYSLVDICFIFREDRRCIHDLIAKTMVVDISGT